MGDTVLRMRGGWLALRRGPRGAACAIGVCCLAAVLLLGAACASKDGAGAVPQPEPLEPERVDAPYTIRPGDGVVGYFTFDEEVSDNQVPDHSGRGAGARTGASGTVRTDGHDGAALFFGGDEYLELADSLLDGDGVTVAAWVNPADWKDWARFVDIGDAEADIWVGKDSATERLRTFVADAADAVTFLTPLPRTMEWTHLALVVGGSDVSLYVNGELAERRESSVSMDSFRRSPPNGIYLGRSNWPDTPLFEGAMDGVLVAARAFGAGEVAAVYMGVVAPDAPEY